jgi:hypothetical protein
MRFPPIVETVIFPGNSKKLKFTTILACAVVLAVVVPDMAFLKTFKKSQ